MYSPVSMREILAGVYIPPVAINVRKHSILEDPPKAKPARVPRIRDTSKNKARLAAMREATRQRILNWFPKANGQCVAELCDTVGMSRSIVQKTVNELLARGVLTRKRVTQKSGGYMFAYYKAEQ